ncbi:single-stranded DNA-binding protein [Clostridium butyricum]|uniref:single-stranded DNA-binding protein n=1 Tax=Clostridium butyricum TaxID=1492 RepID=UPI002ABE8494|nr:single-stranded DNA-binding protein [Clostridium butyricum]
MNKVVLIGRLTKDPDLRFIPGSGTATTNITLAVDKYNSKTGQNEADFIPIVLWGKQAENTANYMSKGSQIAISGRIQVRSYEAKDGTKRYVTEIVAMEVQFLSKGSAQGNPGAAYGMNQENNFDEGFNQGDYEETPFR